MQIEQEQLILLGYKIEYDLIRTKFPAQVWIRSPGPDISVILFNSFELYNLQINLTQIGITNAFPKGISIQEMDLRIALASSYGVR